MMGLFFERIRAILLLSCFVCFCGIFFSCEMYTDDILFSQNQNTKNQGFVRLELSVESQQANDFGFICIPTGVTVSITAYLPNYNDAESDVIIGEIGSVSSAVRISKSVLPLASVVQSDSGMLQVELSPADISLEHTDFSIIFAPASNSGSMAQTRSMTLRYNTPPRAPLGVVADSEGNLRLMENGLWDVVSGTGDKSKDGYIFWAWPKGMTIQSGCDQRLPDCISTFVLNGRAYTPAECATSIVLQCEEGKEYDVYRLYVGHKSLVELYAKDVESVQGASMVSGIEFVELSLNSSGGSFEGMEEQSMDFFYKQGIECSLSDLPVPVMDGYVFSGWSIAGTDTPLSFPFLLEENVALAALWQNPATVGEVRDLQGLFKSEDSVVVLTWNRPYVLDVAGLQIVLQGESVEQKQFVGGDVNEIVFEGVERDTGDYFVTITLVDSNGNKSAGISTTVSANTEFYDEVGNLQAIVLSDRIDFSWTSPPKDDVSHILITCHGLEGEIIGNPHTVDKSERSTSISIEEDWPEKFHFHTVDFQGNVSEGMTMYTIELEIDGDSDSIDHRLVVPANMSLESSPSYYLLDTPVREGFVFDGWYADDSLEYPYIVPMLVSEPFKMYAKWTEEVMVENVDEIEKSEHVVLDEKVEINVEKLGVNENSMVDDNDSANDVSIDSLESISSSEGHVILKVADEKEFVGTVEMSEDGINLRVQTGDENHTKGNQKGEISDAQTLSLITEAP